MRQAKIPCVYCGEIRKYPEEFPILHYSKCRYCFEEDEMKKEERKMKNKRLLWLGLIFIALAFSLFLMIECKPRSCPLKLADATTFVTHDDGRTEILLICLNLSDRYVFGIIAEVTIAHMQTKEVRDQIRMHIGTIEPTGMKRFSVWTDRLTFGEDVGVRASFTYTGMK